MDFTDQGMVFSFFCFVFPSYTFPCIWAHGLGWEVSPRCSWLLLRCHFCGASGKAGQELLPLWIASEEQLLQKWERKCSILNSSCYCCRLRRCSGVTILTGAANLDSSCRIFHCVSHRLGKKEGPSGFKFFVSQWLFIYILSAVTLEA